MRPPRTCVAAEAATTLGAASVEVGYHPNGTDVAVLCVDNWTETDI